MLLGLRRFPDEKVLVSFSRPMIQTEANPRLSSSSLQFPMRSLSACFSESTLSMTYSDDDCDDASITLDDICRVRFDPVVRVHQHPLVLGDHPEVSTGVPLTLDWTVQDSLTDVLRDEESKPRRLSPTLRKMIATETDGKQRVRQAQDEVHLVRKSRQESCKKTLMERVLRRSSWNQISSSL